MHTKKRGVCGSIPPHSATYSRGRVRIHSATLRSYACGRGGIGRRIRFRILRHTVCRFDPCRPHQKQKGCRRASLLLLVQARGRTPRPCLLLFLISRYAAEKNGGFAKQNDDVESSRRSSRVCGNAAVSNRPLRLFLLPLCYWQYLLEICQKL